MSGHRLSSKALSSKAQSSAPQPPSPQSAAPVWLASAPALFVLIWSTGWIAAGFAAQSADALTFLSVRHALAAVVLAALVFWRGDVWPRKGSQIAHALVAGVMVSGLYLAGVWWAVRAGVPAGLSGVIAALQPLMTALLAPLLIRETVTARQYAGIGLGFAGLLVTFLPRMAGLEAAQFQAALFPIFINVLGMLSVTLGSFYQKRFVTGMELLPATVWQFAGAFLITLPLAWLFEPMRIDWTPTAILTMVWSVLVLSIGGVSLFLQMIRRGAVARAATFIYLVPAVSAAMAWAAFGEAMGAVQVLGLIITVFGVWLASR